MPTTSAPPPGDLRAAVAALVDRHRPDTARIVEAAFEVASTVIQAAGGVSDDEVAALIDAFAELTPGDWTNPLTVRRVATATGDRATTRAVLAETAQTDRPLAWATFVDLMRVAHAAGAADPLPSRKESERIDQLRAELAAVLDAAGIDVGAGPPDASAHAVEPIEETGPPEIDAERFETALASLDRLIGLGEVKGEIRRLADRAWIDRLRTEHGLKTASSTRHLVFVGNPGTGKTTVARIVAEVYAALGVVPKGHLVEVGRADLVAGYVGQTAGRTREVFGRAIGGMLFVDEAYSLVRDTEKDFGKEALDTLVAEMENNRHDTAVVVAGYPLEMAVFMEANPGLASRFPKTVEFPDYSTEELVDIAALMVGGNDYDLDDDAAAALGQWLDTVPRGRGFGNGRLVRNALDVVFDCQAQRLVSAGARRDGARVAPEALREVRAEDVQPAALDPLLDALR